jgi:hypothetical protein
LEASTSALGAAVALSNLDSAAPAVLDNNNKLDNNNDAPLLSELAYRKVVPGSSGKWTCDKLGQHAIRLSP